jgi:hypothetical protein
MSRFNYRSFINDENGGVPHGFTLIVFILVVFAVIGTFKSVAGHANAGGGVIRSAVSGYCLDDSNNGSKPSSIVDTYNCNDTEAQAWAIDGVSVKHGNLCMSAGNQGKIVLDGCVAGANQAWLKDYNGFLNPDSGKCLSLPNGKTGEQLTLSDCSGLSSQSESWVSKAPYSCNESTPGEKIACSAIAQWSSWNSTGADHNALLNTYTDGAPYEEWCADFVSYIYKQAGYPFTGGETDGWDENNANNIQNLGFTQHEPNNYQPQPGDVAYFNYDGGHVEIVVSGGAKPTFIYGNSGKVDPATGNGNMAANTLTQDGSSGQLVSYLSPNF